MFQLHTLNLHKLIVHFHQHKTAAAIPRLHSGQKIK